MKFFEAVPSELFSPLASPNRILYADALDVLYAAYQENLKIREDVLYSMLRGRLEQELADATFEDEDIDEEELRDISGRARFLIRKLCSKGWFEKERGDDFEEYITIPNYSSRLLELFHQLCDDSPARGYSYVFGTFSVLKTADDNNNAYDKMTALYSAYDNTTALISLLQMVYHNVKHYFQTQIDMQDVNQVLAAHFNDFGQKVVEAYIRPLKIKDSVPKYRVPIQSVLRRWEEDDTLLMAMANEALRDKRGKTLEDCRADLLRKIFWIEERYDNLEKDYLEEIDTQVRRYTRAATQKIENLTNRDQSVRGNLNVLLTALSRNRRASELVDQIQPAFQLYEQSFLSEKSLWYRKRPEKRTKTASVLIQDDQALNTEEQVRAAQLLQSKYGRAAVNAYVQGWLGDADIRCSEELSLEEDKDLLNTEKALRDEQKKLEQGLQNLEVEIKREARHLQRFCGEIQELEPEELLIPVQEAANTAQKAYAVFTGDEKGLFARPVELFETGQQAVAELSDAVRSAAHKTEDRIAELKKQADQKSAVLANLRRNIKDYPHGLLLFKDRLEKDLADKTGHAVPVYILADVLEMADERWRGAVEGYLNNQKYYLLVEPGRYQDALNIYDRLKQEAEYRAFGLVDIGKLREKETLRPLPGSLAEKVETENKLARSYVDYLLGRVICCDTAEQLRCYKTAITAEGMLYQGYVARALRKGWMEDAFIGRRAVQLRIDHLEKELACLQEELRHWQPLQKQLTGLQEPLFTQRFVRIDVAQKQEDYQRVQTIIKEIAEVKNQLSQLNLFWLDEQRRIIEQLKEEILAFNKEKDAKNVQKGKLEDRIHQLEYEILPEKYQRYEAIEDVLNEEFTKEYRETIGVPRYRQELVRLKKADVIRKNFGDSLAQSTKAMDGAQKKLLAARREYAERFKPCAFQIEVMDNTEYEEERRTLQESELPRYKEKIRAARESAMEQFQNDFLAKLKSSIDQVQDQVHNLNKALRQAQFGTDKYQFRVGPNPDYLDYYNMITADELMEGESGLFALPFQQKYGPLIEKLFSQITMADDTQLNVRKQSELQENIVRYTDFRTYLKFDLETTDQNGSKQLLSQTLNMKSGGETQTPFYIAVLASFAQLYRVNDATRFGNTVRLVVFDEAFNKMDSDRITESVLLLRKMGLQAIICTPPDKVSDIMPIADRTLLVDKSGYRMHIIPFGKEMQNEGSTGDPESSAG